MQTLDDIWQCVGLRKVLLNLLPKHVKGDGLDEVPRTSILHHRFHDTPRHLFPELSPGLKHQCGLLAFLTLYPFTDDGVDRLGRLMVRAAHAHANQRQGSSSAPSRPSQPPIIDPSEPLPLSCLLDPPVTRGGELEVDLGDEGGNRHPQPYQPLPPPQVTRGPLTASGRCRLIRWPQIGLTQGSSRP